MSSRRRARPARCQDRPRAARVCQILGFTAGVDRTEEGSQLRGVCVASENSQASESKPNVKSVLAFITMTPIPLQHVEGGASTLERNVTLTLTEGAL